MISVSPFCMSLKQTACVGNVSRHYASCKEGRKSGDLENLDLDLGSMPWSSGFQSVLSV